jgi:hypothetical protein
MAGAGMTRNTFRFHLERLCNAGLIKVEQRAGEHGGNFYTVLLPEEAGFQRGDRGHRGESGHPGDMGENLPLVEGSEIDPSNRSLSSAESIAYGDIKTSFKTREIKTDDEAFARFVVAIKKAVREITGKDPSPDDAERWEEVAEVLITELKIAAARTTVSSAPAFLAEHLRRRLFKKDKQQIESEAGAPAPPPSSALDKAGCPDCGGAGYYYPQGYDKGVARCDHQKLRGGPTP